VIDQYWAQAGVAKDRFQYGYDRDSNRLYRDNLVNASFGELYHANGASNGYDGFNQLSAFARGALNSTHDTITTPSHSQGWGLDNVGNWKNFTNDQTGPPSETRGHNAQNQIIRIPDQRSSHAHLERGAKCRRQCGVNAKGADVRR